MDSDEDLRGLIGLQNLGNTCYINATLQALSNCQQLTRFILDCPNLVKETGLSRCYSDLINEIWNPNNSTQYAVPTSIIRNIKCIYPAFRGCSQQDSQEFLRCFLEQLHDELKTQQSETTDASSSSSNNSIVSDIFDFRISSSIVCSICNNKSTTKETFKDLSVPIPSRYHPYYQQQQQTEISDEANTRQGNTRKDDDDDDNGDETAGGGCSNSGDSVTNESSDRQLQAASYYYYLDPLAMAKWFYDWFSSLGSWFWGPQVTLHDCLSVFFGTDPLEGENEYSCETCTKKNRGVKYLKILELPEVLCIHFKRYESVGSAKITTHVSFPLTGLDLAPFMCSSSEVQCTTYNLIACICHHGSALMTGHYTTYALNCYDDQWYEFDDQYVTSVSSYQVENSEAYILFYQKATTDGSTDGYESDTLQKSDKEEDGQEEESSRR